MGLASASLVIVILVLAVSVGVLLQDESFLELVRSMLASTASTPDVSEDSQGEGSGSAGASKGLFRVIGEVDHIHCTSEAASETECLSAVAKQRTPLVITKTSAAEWPALKLWGSDEYLAGAVPAETVLADVRVGEERIFVAAQDKPNQLPRDESLGLARRDRYRFVNMSMAELLGQISQGADAEEHAFYTNLVSTLESPQLADDIEPQESFALGSDHEATTVWFSQAGNVANVHYDKSVNFVAQVVGQKRWLLFPPTEWERLYLHPSLHRHYHQSQVNLTDPRANAGLPLLARAEAFEVVLNPGEVLFVPPFWFHCVEALTKSISVSMITPSQEEILYGEAYWHPVPFVKEWPEPVRVKYVAEYLRYLVKATSGAGDPNRFVRSMLLEARWDPVFTGRLAAADPTFKIAQCSSQFGELDSALLARFTESTAETTAYLNKIVDADVRFILLGNLIEELSRFATGGKAEHVPVFLEKCFPAPEEFRATPMLSAINPGAPQKF